MRILLLTSACSVDCEVPTCWTALLLSEYRDYWILRRSAPIAFAKGYVSPKTRPENSCKCNMHALCYQRSSENAFDSLTVKGVKHWFLCYVPVLAVNVALHPLSLETPLARLVYIDRVDIAGIWSLTPTA
jgi:hypothetical protein